MGYNPYYTPVFIHPLSEQKKWVICNVMKVLNVFAKSELVLKDLMGPINYSDQSKQKHHGNCDVMCVLFGGRLDILSIKYSVCCMWYVIVSRSGFGAWIALLMPSKQIISSS